MDREVAAREVVARVTQASKKAREDVLAFMEHVLTTDEGGVVRLAPLHRVWLRHVSWCWQNNYHALVLAPFAHAKSTILAIGLVLFLLGRSPGSRVKIVSNIDDEAQKRVRAISKVIRHSPNFRATFPACTAAKEGSWTQHEIWLQGPRGAISHSPTLQAKSIFATGIGGRADYLVFDDVVDQKNALDEPEKRARVIEDFHSTWMSRLEPDGRVAAIGTVWHREDLWHHLMRNPRWVTLRQSIKGDLSGIEQEVWNAPPEYPGLLDRERLERDKKLVSAALL